MRVMYQREILAGLIAIVAIIAIYSTFNPKDCTDLACFEAHMSKCKPAIYINDEGTEATWQYRVIGTSDKKCDVEVELLIAKESNLDLREYEGESMICSYELGSVGYPEKNLGACRGYLKEGLQEIVIEKLYKYIVANIGDIRDELSNF